MEAVIGKHSEKENDWAISLENIGATVVRYGLVVILLWIGGVKFTAYEAEGIKGLIENSPLMSWAYGVFSVRSYAAIIGSSEIIFGILISIRPFAPKLSAAGSGGAILMFLTTLSFMLTTPGVWQTGYGFPFLGSSGQFLIKDLVLLGAATWTAGESFRAAQRV